PGPAGIQQALPLLPEGLAEPDQGRGVVARGQVDPVAEPDEVGQGVKLLGLSVPTGQAQLAVEVVLPLAQAGEAHGAAEAPAEHVDGLGVVAVDSIAPPFLQAGPESDDALPVGGGRGPQSHADGQQDGEPGDAPGHRAGMATAPLLPTLAGTPVTHAAQR